MGPHPERPERIAAIERELEARDWLGWERRESPEAEDAALLAVHPSEHIGFIRELSESGGAAINMDTSTNEHSYVAALHGAGGRARGSARSSPRARPAR